VCTKVVNVKLSALVPSYDRVDMEGMCSVDVVRQFNAAVGPLVEVNQTLRIPTLCSLWLRVWLQAGWLVWSCLRWCVPSCVCLRVCVLSWVEIYVTYLLRSYLRSTYKSTE
jgi:tetrahydromethanopterin S-methyltransferase subunit C